MEIAWYGHNCFRMIERSMASIVTDPYDGSVGYPMPKLRADIVTISHDAPGYNNWGMVSRVQHMLTGPGEYEIGGVFITAVATYPPRKRQDIVRNVVFMFDFDGLTVCHLGKLAYIPGQSQVEDLGAIDVLLVPVGGGGGLNSAQAAEMVSLIDPALVIPMHYRTDDCKIKLDGLDKFLKEMGVPSVVEEESLKISHSSLPEDTQIVVLEHRHRNRDTGAA
jgi:L-ascorbate metabolism protein UlaG (beta-lactamase superfamily)